MDAHVRNELAELARGRRTRTREFSRDRPVRWRPSAVANPGDPGSNFTEEGAWELLADRLTAGHPVEEVELRFPPGKRGYVMKISLGTDHPLLYIKFQRGSGQIIGRSFHYSNTGNDE